MANAILLQSGALRDFQPLGADGNPVYQAAPQLRAAIKRTLGEEVANLFAIPQRSEDGNRIDWYAPGGGSVVPWSSATPEEQRQAKEQLWAARERINETGRRMQSQQESERQVFGRLLEHVTSVPNEGHVQLVDGRPVMTFWGFHEHGARPDHDALSLLPVMEPDTAGTAAELADAEAGRRFRWWWLLLPLLLLLLLLLAFLLLRGCAPAGLPGLDPPNLGLPELAPHDRAPATQEALPADTVRLPETRVVIGADTGGIAGPDATIPELAAGKEMPAADALSETPDEALALPEEPPLDEAAAEQPVGDQVLPGPEPGVPPDSGEPLAIPPEAVESGSTDFLNGRWSADSGLMDRSGRPVDVEYEFKQGKGVARYRRSNGVVCEGPTSAAMSGGRLVITDGANIVCQDGVRFRKSRVECHMGDGGLANCTGSYATGESFSVGMDKANNN